MLKRLTCFLLACFLSFSLYAPSLPALEPPLGNRPGSFSENEKAKTSEQTPLPIRKSTEREDLELLNKIEKDTLQYFIRFSDKTTGLTKDSSRAGSPSSVAATGFALAAYAIGGSRGWIAQDYAYTRILTTLRTLRHKAAHQEGFFYHFLDNRTGNRVWTSEASSIDTALVVAGVLLAAQYYPGTEIEKLAREIYERVHWKWMMNHRILSAWAGPRNRNSFPTIGILTTNL